MNATGAVSTPGLYCEQLAPPTLGMAVPFLAASDVLGQWSSESTRNRPCERRFIMSYAEIQTSDQIFNMHPSIRVVYHGSLSVTASSGECALGNSRQWSCFARTAGTALQTTCSASATRSAG